MKKGLLWIALALFCVCALAACAPSEPESTTAPKELLSAAMVSAEEQRIVSGKEYLPEGSVYVSGNGEKDVNLSESQISMLYGDLSGAPDFSVIESYAVFLADGSVSTEIGIFKASESDGVDTIKDYIENRVKALKSNSEGYNAEELAKAENALITVKGKYVYYIITDINESLAKVVSDGIETLYIG